MPEAPSTSLDRSTGKVKDSKSYTNWLHWWKSVYASEDYQKYVATKDTDYLALIFHLYDSEEEFDSDDERDLLLGKIFFSILPATHGFIVIFPVLVNRLLFYLSKLLIYAD